MPTTASPQSITLYYKSGSSDKVYNASVEAKGNGFVVNFSFGRRGSTLQTGTKTASPVDFAAAKKIFDKLVAEKTAKGYSPGEAGTPYQQTDQEQRATGVVPQLLNAIEENQAAACLEGSDWWGQEKLDGKRVLIRKVGAEITGINRRGLSIALPEPVAALARKLGDDQWVLDGEAIGDVYVAFDLLESARVDLRSEPFSKRLKMLEKIIADNSAAPIRRVTTAQTKTAKAALLAQLKSANREGIVFKRHEAPYVAGRPASGGDQVKLKFTATVSCLVAGVNGAKRSVALELLDGQRRVGVGNVTIPPGTPIPAAGQIAEIRYLYAFSGGSLFQPVYLGIRDDLTADACMIGQLKFKPTDDADEG